MPFDTLNSDAKLVLADYLAADLSKCAFEKLIITERGKADRLELYYEGHIEAIADLNAWTWERESGEDLSPGIEPYRATTPGTWYLDKFERVSPDEDIPFVTWRATCLGVATPAVGVDPKGDAVRWFGTTETQSGQDIAYLGVTWPTLNAELLSVGVEIDTVLVGSEPDMTKISTALTPPNDPAVRDSFWGFLVDPTYNHPNGWFLSDIKPRQLCGRTDFWEATYVYRYKYALSP